MMKLEKTKVSSKNKHCFTLIELAAVAVILGIAVTMFITRIDNMVPAARLSSAARYLGSSVELALSDAVMKGRTRYVLYDREAGTVSIGKEGDDPSRLEIITSKRLPSGVEIVDIQGLDEKEGKAVAVITSSGRTVPHAVYLRHGENGMTVEVFGITGRIKYHRGRAELTEFATATETEL